MNGYRPSRFSEVVGQESTVQTLKYAIQKKRLAHAYLFSGSHGTGKTTLARLFAKALNCKAPTKEGEPCTECIHCREIERAHSLDVIEIDGASHRGIEDIRKINETCAFIPTSCTYKIYLIDEVHMLTKEAFNALLKTLEEPPKNVKFFFATTEPHKIPKTILSRCQRFHLKRIPIEQIVEKLRRLALSQAIDAEEAALSLIARFAKGGMRDAESLFDQLVVFEEGKITRSGAHSLLGITSKEFFFRLDHAHLEKDLGLIFEITKEVIDGGKSALHFLGELTEHYRTLLLLKADSPTVFYDDDEKEAYQKSASLYDISQLITLFSLLQEAESKYQFALSDRIWLEQILFKILQSKGIVTIEGLVDKLLSLEKKITSQGMTVPQEVKKPVSPPSEVKKTEVTVPKKDPSLKEQSRYDTIMRFASKELNGSLKI